MSHGTHNGEGTGRPEGALQRALANGKEWACAVLEQARRAVVRGVWQATAIGVVVVGAFIVVVTGIVLLLIGLARILDSATGANGTGQVIVGGAIAVVTTVVVAVLWRGGRKAQSSRPLDSRASVEDENDGSQSS